MLTKFYENFELNNIDKKKLSYEAKKLFGIEKFSILSCENCFYFETSAELSSNDYFIISSILGNSRSISNFEDIIVDSDVFIIEIGPRLNYSSAYSTNAVSIFNSLNLKHITRIECARRYCLQADAQIRKEISAIFFDKMTECVYDNLITFDQCIFPEGVYEVDILSKQEFALIELAKKLGLSFDQWDLDFYTNMFINHYKRNPTNVEVFDLAQSNSEHSRHWYFKGQFIIDDKKCDLSLFKMIMNTQQYSNNNNVIKFADNSSGITGFPIKTLYPTSVEKGDKFYIQENMMRHIVFTAETHNFPTAVAPFPGATTGTGGRIRDVQATGRGAHVIAGTVGYCFGNLHIPGYYLSFEDNNEKYPSNFASPLKVIIEASNGASDYGNKFGEPVICGFARSFGLAVGMERREWIKPIMFSGGIGSIEEIHLKKEEPETGMVVVKIGGPVLRIGVGGGGASSVSIQGSQDLSLDFDAVQRGDAEMEQRMNRVVRASIERLHENPICSIHDQGAGGNGNVLKELCYPKGAIINLSKFQLGDSSLSALEVWGSEYQESNALLCREENVFILEKIANREKCPISFVGKISNDGYIKFMDDRWSGDSNNLVPIDFDLSTVLGDMPQKIYNVKRVKARLEKFVPPANLTIIEALNKVLRLPSVASKRYLTNKVDRSVTGLIAQQQCVGPLHTPLADVAVVALSMFEIKGAATAVGEQPIKMLVDVECGARMAVGEALTNLVFASITCLQDVKCSGNWMWPAKHEGEDAKLYDACVAMCEIMKNIGIAVDGGKDSLSMAALVPEGEIVKSPGNLVISAYAACPDITATVTPDLKFDNNLSGVILWVQMSRNQGRLGGSALAQCFKSIGDQSPDLDDPQLFISAFNITQQLIRERKLISGHDVSDGGLITCVLEMAFAGNCGIDIKLLKKDQQQSLLEFLFAEELGLVFEVSATNEQYVVNAFATAGVTCINIGHSLTYNKQVCITVDDVIVLSEPMVELRSIWEATSFQLEKLQCNIECVEMEAQGLMLGTVPSYKLTFNPNQFKNTISSTLMGPPKVAIIREEGSNGDREMAVAFYLAGFEVWDVCMQDFLIDPNFSLNQFCGIAFVGGFSYADVFGSAKGWASVIRLNAKVAFEFKTFYERSDTFSFGVCNGCQLMARLGWIGSNSDDQPGLELKHNKSSRFESRFVSVRINESPSIMFKGMHGSVIGVWVAHGEGFMQFSNESIQSSIVENNLVALSYTDFNGIPTESYPMNPNGSPLGIAGLCSEDGRHLGLMPHPERGIQMWQWAWAPPEWRNMDISPWSYIFSNAYEWCATNRNSL